MAKQLIFCLETSDNSDWVYIRDTISKYFEDNPKIKLSPIFTTSKTELLSAKTLKKVQRRITEYRGNSVVIICYDTDSFETSPEDNARNNDIRTIVEAKGWESVWFCHTIEEVYLGRTVPNSQKTIEANHFRRSSKIDEVSEQNLTANCTPVIFTSKKSNILSVLRRIYTP